MSRQLYLNFIKDNRWKYIVNGLGTTLQITFFAVILALGIWGAINLLEGYGNDNPGAKSQGMKQFMAN